MKWGKTDMGLYEFEDPGAVALLFENPGAVALLEFCEQSEQNSSIYIYVMRNQWICAIVGYYMNRLIACQSMDTMDNDPF